MPMCRDCGRPFSGHRKTRRCLVCRVAATLRDFRYTPDPYAVAEYRQDEAAWAARPEPAERSEAWTAPAR